MLHLDEGPEGEPITLGEAKLHCKVEHNEDDILFNSWITSARMTVEAFTRRALMTQTWNLKLDGFPACGYLELPLAPLQEIDEISYVDANGDGQTWDDANYIVDAPTGPMAQPGTVTLGYQASWPVTRAQKNAVTITFIAGYGDATEVPDPFKSAMKLIIGHLNNNRESVVITGRGSVVAEIPQAVESILWPFRVLRF